MDSEHLPEDIILEIFLKLTVKSLVRLKCVCKHWCALIESANFVKRHFDHENNKERLLVRHCKPDETYAFALHSDDDTYEEPAHLQMPFSVGALLGPLNGIFCMVNIWGRMALFNPATRQFRLLPLSSPKIEQHLATYEDLLGFGIDPLTGDFKVVSLWFFWNEETDVAHYPSLVSVYNSGSDSWRHFEDVELVNSSRNAYKSLCNTYLNGTYYWLVELNETDIAILAFDMTSEKFREIQVPASIKSKGGELCLYEGSIALLQCDENKIDKFVDVWVVKNEDCWIKTLTVGPFQDIRWPLGFWGNSELLLETEDPQLHVYNINARKLRTIEVRRKENGFFIYWVSAYKESLVSIKRQGCRCGQWDLSSDLVNDFITKPSNRGFDSHGRTKHFVQGLIMMHFIEEKRRIKRLVHYSRRCGASLYWQRFHGRHYKIEFRLWKIGQKEEQ